MYILQKRRFKYYCLTIITWKIIIFFTCNYLFLTIYIQILITYILKIFICKSSLLSIFIEISKSNTNNKILNNINFKTIQNLFSQLFFIGLFSNNIQMCSQILSQFQTEAQIKEMNFVCKWRGSLSVFNFLNNKFKIVVSEQELNRKYIRTNNLDFMVINQAEILFLFKF